MLCSFWHIFTYSFSFIPHHLGQWISSFILIDHLNSHKQFYNSYPKNSNEVRGKADKWTCLLNPDPMSSYYINISIMLSAFLKYARLGDSPCKCWLFSSFSGLDFLPQLNSVLPPRKNPVVSSTSVLHSSPLNVFMGSPGKEENENHDLTAESKKMYLGKQESKDSFKQVSACKWYWTHCVCLLLASIMHLITRKQAAATGYVLIIDSAVHLLGGKYS